jgi:DNA mismatch repair protein MutL
VLPEETVNRVAAGEVVERPAAALKELLENSLDAGAAQVDVELSRAGTGLVRVCDDGAGMSQDDLVLALERHATSKIASVEDLWGVATFGFRGEALPSIAAVSRLRIETRERGAGGGWLLEADGGKLVRVAPCGCPEGTLIEARDLFHSVPARLKFLRSPATELGHCVQVAARLALACPALGIRLRHDGRELLRLPPDASAGERLRAYLGRDFFAGLVPVRGAGAGCAVSGFVSRPGAGRPGADWQQIFVNGRPVRDPLLAAGLREACRDHFLQQRHGAAYFLWLTLPPGGVDVNVHPTKREVRFSEPAAVVRVVGDALRAALRGDRLLALAPRAGADAPPLSPAPGGTDACGDAGAAAEPGSAAAYSGPVEPQTSLPLAPEAAHAAAAPGGAGRSQLFGTYLVCPCPVGLVLVDQHAAHERVLYERYLARPAGGASQLLLEPLLFDATAGEEAAFETLQPVLADLGIALEAIGPRAFRVLALPPELRPADAVPFVRDMASLALEGSAPPRVEDFRHRAAALLACHTAIRANQRLADAEIAALLHDLSRSANPGDCPHGRPTSIVIDRAEIERRFKRT